MVRPTRAKIQEVDNENNCIDCKKKSAQCGLIIRPVVLSSGGFLSLYEWEQEMPGPHGSVWEEGVFNVQLKVFPELSIRFCPPVFHPNVNPVDGSVNTSQLSLAEVITVDELFTSLQEFLAKPNLKFQINPEAVYLYQNRQCDYNKKVREDIRKNH